MLRKLWCITWALFFAVVAPTPVVAAAGAEMDDASLDRAERLHHVLSDTRKVAEDHDLTWPDQIVGDSSHVIYIKPPRLPDFSKSRTWTNELRRADNLTYGTVVAYESFADHAQGIWVAFEDGHLEFAPDAAALADCLARPEIIKPITDRLEAISPYPRRESTTQPTPTTQLTGELRLQLLHPDGSPAPGLVGRRFNSGNLFPLNPKVFMFSASNPDEMLVVSADRQGVAAMDAQNLRGDFGSSKPDVSMVAFDSRGENGAIFKVARTEVNSGVVHKVELQPLCDVKLHLSCSLLRRYGMRIDDVICEVQHEAGDYLDWNVEFRNWGNEGATDVRLPPGAYELILRTGHGNNALLYIRVPPGKREMESWIDLAINDSAYWPTHGKSLAAPELTNIRAWSDNKPVRLSDLHGKLVLMDFWGYWCPYCVESMPTLMSLYDQYHDKGLEVIAVHDSSVDSIEEMRQKLTDIRHKDWHDRDLPFAVAIDSAAANDPNPHGGVNTKAYEVTLFPTTFVIQDGKILGRLDLSHPDAKNEVRKLLQQSQNQGK